MTARNQSNNNAQITTKATAMSKQRVVELYFALLGTDRAVAADWEMRRPNQNLQSAIWLTQRCGERLWQSLVRLDVTCCAFQNVEHWLLEMATQVEHGVV